MNDQSNLENKLQQARRMNLILGSVIAVYFIIKLMGLLIQDPLETRQPAPRSVSPEPAAGVSLDYDRLTGDWDFHSRLAWAYLGKQMEDAALHHYLEVCRLNPQEPGATNNVGYLLYKRGEYDKAERYLKQALVLDPNSELAKNNLALVEQARAKSRGQ